jgi:hypothetical protein
MVVVQVVTGLAWLQTRLAWLLSTMALHASESGRASGKVGRYYLVESERARERRRERSASFAEDALVRNGMFRYSVISRLDNLSLARVSAPQVSYVFFPAWDPCFAEMKGSAGVARPAGCRGFLREAGGRAGVDRGNSPSGRAGDKISARV